MWKNGIKMRGTRRQSRRHPQQVTTAVMLLRLLLVMLLQTTTVTEASSSEGKVPQTTPIAKEMEEGRDNDHRRSEHTTALSILDSLLRGYDRRATPTNHLGKPTTVECKLYVRSLGSINSDTMDYQVDLYLRQHWSDPRLNHEGLVEPLDLNDPNLVKAIWKPEVYFPNAKDAEFQYVTVPNVLVRIDPGGQILYMLRLKLKFSCMMELSNFPLDEQICTMEIASFSKTTKELILRWKEDGGVDISQEVKMPQFEIFEVVPAKCQETFHIGNYSCLQAKLHLKRSLGFHMVQSYLPTILIVVISWVSFWMDVDSVAGRTTLGVTTLLTVSSKASDVQAEVPLVSYVKAIDIWMGSCTAFIFAALLEFTLTNYLWRKGRKGGPRRIIKEAQTPSENGGHGMEVFNTAGPIPGNCGADEADGGGIAEDNVDQLDCGDGEGAPSAAPASAGGERLFDREFGRFNGKLRDTEVVDDIDCVRVQLQQHQQQHAASNRFCERCRRFSFLLRSTPGGIGGDGLMTSSGDRDFAESPVLNKYGGGRINSLPPFLVAGDVSDCLLAIRIDEWSRTLFPVTFLLFNLFYWAYFTQWAK